MNKLTLSDLFSGYIVALIATFIFMVAQGVDLTIVDQSLRAAFLVAPCFLIIGYVMKVCWRLVTLMHEKLFN